MSANDTAGDGQGQQETPGVFDSFLASVPETWGDDLSRTPREIVTEYLKGAEKEVNGRYQEAAQLRQTYEPFTSIEGLDQYDAESLSSLIQFHQDFSQEGGPERWVRGLAEELGLSFAEAEAVTEQAAAEGINPQQLSQLVQEAVAPLNERLSNFESAQAQAQIKVEIGQDFERLEAQHGTKYNEDEKGMILDLAASDGFVGAADWMDKAVERFNAIRGLGANSVIDTSTQQPATALTTGGTAAQEPVTDFKTAGEQAREMIRRNRG